MNKIVTYGDEYRKYYKVDDRTYYTYDDAVRDYKYYQMVDPIEESKEELEAREKAEKREKRINMILGE